MQQDKAFVDTFQGKHQPTMAKPINCYHTKADDIADKFGEQRHQSPFNGGLRIGELYIQYQQGDDNREYAITEQDNAVFTRMLIFLRYNLCILLYLHIL